MKQITFPPNGQTTDLQLASFFRITHELGDRYKRGLLPHDFTLQGLQQLLENKYSFQTDFGVFKLFGHSIKVYDVQTRSGYGPEEFFKEENIPNIAKAERLPYTEEFIQSFKVDSASTAQLIVLAPYRFPEKANIEYILDEISNQRLFPKITLGHMEGMLKNYTSGFSRDEALFEGIDGNYFPIRDNQKQIWLIRVWLHSDGHWYYKFINSADFSKEKLRPNGRLWLISRKDYLANGNDCSSFV